MAAYRRVDDLTVTCRLTACTPGSAPAQRSASSMGKPLPAFSLYISSSSKCLWRLVLFQDSVISPPFSPSSLFFPLIFHFCSTTLPFHYFFPFPLAFPSLSTHSVPFFFLCLNVFYSSTFPPSPSCFSSFLFFPVEFVML